MAKHDLHLMLCLSEDATAAQLRAAYEQAVNAAARGYNTRRAAELSRAYDRLPESLRQQMYPARGIRHIRTSAPPPMVQTRPLRRRRQRRVGWQVPLTVTVVAAVFGVGIALDPSSVPPGIRTAFGFGPHRLAPAVDATAAGSFAYLQQQPDSSEPVRWDPCKPIHYVINPAGAPADGVLIMQSAIAEAAAATGLKFVYDGMSDRRPSWKSHTVLVTSVPDDPVLISWATADEVPGLAGNVAGLGGSAPFPMRGRLVYTTGGVTLDTDAYRTIATRPDGAAEQRAIDLHELGHLVGLDHVPDPTQLMYEENVGQPDYAAGDRAGLAELGKGRCF